MNCSNIIMGRAKTSHQTHVHRVHINEGVTLRVDNGIAAMRREKGLKQAELAERLEIPRPLLSYYETGRTIPDYELVKRMAKEL